jgi:hypothetical protein
MNISHTYINFHRTPGQKFLADVVKASGSFNMVVFAFSLADTNYAAVQIIHARKSHETRRQKGQSASGRPSHRRKNEGAGCSRPLRRL